MLVVRIFEAREVSVDEIKERDEHEEASDVGIVVVVGTIDEHAANQRRDDP